MKNYYRRNWNFIYEILSAIYNRTTDGAYRDASENEKDCWAVFTPLLAQEKIFTAEAEITEAYFDIDDLADARLTMKGYDLYMFLYSHDDWDGYWTEIWETLKKPGVKTDKDWDRENDNE